MRVGARRGARQGWHSAVWKPTDRPTAHEIAGDAPADAPVDLIPRTRWPHVDRLFAKGLVVRVVRGVYAPTAAWSELASGERYLARVHAVALTHPSVVFSHESAAALWGLPVLGDPGTIHLLDDDQGTSRSCGGIRVHTTAAVRDVIELGGFLVTRPMTTAVDIARRRHPVAGLAVADAVLRRNPAASVAQLIADNESRPSSRGRRHARWSLERATAAAESPLESISRAAIEWLGFPKPALQAEFNVAGRLRRVDLWWEHTRTIGEADGDIKYDGRFRDPAQTIRDEKDRDRELRRAAAGIAHWGWRDVAAVAPLRESLLQAGLRPIDPPDVAQLTQMQRALRSRS